MNKPPQDLGIPVLTEVIDVPPRVVHHDDVVEKTAPPAAMPVFHEPQAATTPINGWLTEEWTRLEQKISERVLTQVLDRVDAVIDQRIRDGLMDVLQITIDRLSDELKHGLHQTLQDVITEAVTQEIDRMRFTEN
ncbi:MAG TPA: hypothetical protein VGO72_08180 [Herminiimonas sp.]|jgi:hypothetical protein|nr:hypothetical protein [Herminiimonas sp.]